MISTTALVIELVSVLLHIVHVQAIPNTATTDTLINNCCDLGFRLSTFSDIVNKPKHIQDEEHMWITQLLLMYIYCDTVTAGGGWL